MGAEPQGRAGDGTARSHCATCGWPRGNEVRCATCGAEGGLPLADATRLPEPREAPDAAAAWQAWHTESWPRLVQQAVEMVGGRHVTTAQTAAVNGWSFVAPSGAPVFVSLSQAQAGTPGLVVVEAPVARLPERHRVPAMRVVLELSHHDEVRACLRGDLVLVRIARRLSVATPPVLTRALSRVAELAERWAERLTADFDARAATERAVRPSWDNIGKPRALAAIAPNAAGPLRPAAPLGKPAAIPRPQTAPRPVGVPPPPPKLPRPGVAAPTVPSAGVQPRPAERVEPPGEPPSIARAGEPPSIAREPEPLPPLELPGEPPAPLGPPLAPPQPAAAPRHDSLPAILSPLFVGGAGAASPAAAPPMQGTPIHAVSGPFELELGAASQAARERSDSGPRKISVPPPPAPTGTTPTDKLCDLLRYAQALATALSFEERPATMMLLIRATVYRAVFEYRESVPHAVAHLYKGARGVIREIWTSSPGARRRSSMQIPVAEPLLLVMEQIVAHKAQVPPETPLIVDPLTSADSVRTHLARYVDEIDHAPSDPPLRHFLVLGALTELLVRTRLPPATEQRLRDIVAHGQRDSGRSSSTELMMKALQRIVTG